MPQAGNVSRALSEAQINQFIVDGYTRLDNAFSRELAEEARTILWRDTGSSPTDSATWTRPVIRLGMYHQQPFVAAANTPVLHHAFDQLVGAQRWNPCRAMGTFPVRFPSPEDPGDTGWHVDMSFGYEHPDFMEWRVNIFSKGRALLMLFLFSDVGNDDAPTRIRVGSHWKIARQLAPFGNAGLSLRELAADGFRESADCQEVLAVGDAGTVYLCHPFLVHSAQQHRGERPRFMAQPPLLSRGALELDRPQELASAVERAVQRALGDP